MLFLESGGVIAKTFYLPAGDKDVRFVKKIDEILVQSEPSFFACGCSVVLEKRVREMEKFIKISRYAGMREDLAQAAGGNSAFKIALDRMVIKASGFQLADVTQDTGYAVVNPQIVRDAFLNAGNLEGMTDEESKRILADTFLEGERLSSETFLHLIFGTFYAKWKFIKRTLDFSVKLKRSGMR